MTVFWVIALGRCSWQKGSVRPAKRVESHFIKKITTCPAIVTSTLAQA